MKKVIYFLLFISNYLNGQDIVISGIVREKESYEIIPYANVHLRDSNEGTSSNPYGFFSLRVPKNKDIEITVSSIGYQPISLIIKDTIDHHLIVELESIALELSTVVVIPEGFNDYSIGKIELLPQVVKDMPSLLGEKDVIKMIQLLPGIQKAVEGSTALHVRGGSPGQNLILLDDALVYNANHLFGFVSVFNGNAIKNINFYKGGFPARYGGRISSVLDIQMKDGSQKDFSGEAGIGILSSHLTVEGPIKEGKSSFLVSGRRTYLDLLTMPFMDEDSEFRYRFYDLNIKVNFDYNDKNKFYLSGYFGNDQLLTSENISRTASNIETDFTLGWGNATGSFRWNHIINNKLFLNTTLLYSNFNFILEDDFRRTGNIEEDITSNFRSGISDYSIKGDLDYFINNDHHLKIGASYILHNYRPRAIRSNDRINNIIQNESEEYLNNEYALYAEDNWNINKKLNSNFGVRLSGSHLNNINFINVEPRIKVSYILFDGYKLSGSYSRVNQYIHLLSNTGIGLATDLWVPATKAAPPEKADVYSVSINKSFKVINVSLEAYRKYMSNIITYKEGANFLSIEEGVQEINWEENVTSGNGESYGTELLVEKPKGKVKGWISYTLSWTVNQFDDINGGKKFFPRHDSRHNISVNGQFELSEKIFVSINWIYASGNALTVPQGYYYINIADGTGYRSILNDDGVLIHEPVNSSIGRVAYYGGRNSFRAEDYHRLDVGIQFHKTKKKFKRYWEIGAFNAYNRKNPFYYHLVSKNDYANNGQRIELEKKSLFPVLPYLSYNIIF